MSCLIVLVLLVVVQVRELVVPVCINERVRVRAYVCIDRSAVKAYTRHLHGIRVRAYYHA
jgi:hypothetical protein